MKISDCCFPTAPDFFTGKLMFNLNVERYVCNLFSRMECLGKKLVNTYALDRMLAI